MQVTVNRTTFNGWLQIYLYLFEYQLDTNKDLTLYPSIRKKSPMCNSICFIRSLFLFFYFLI